VTRRSTRIEQRANEKKRISNKISSILQAAGLKVATQKYEYTSAGIGYQGENVYGIIHAPRGDATEAIVLVAAWKTADDELNLNGVTLALTLARYFKREFCSTSSWVCILSNKH
jgi:glycosylphosphatidylinositol transamidase